MTQSEKSTKSLKRSKLYQVVQQMSDQELRDFVKVITNDRTYEACRIVLAAPYHSRPVQVDIVTAELMRRKLPLNLEMRRQLTTERK